MSGPTVSIVIPAYNAERTIAETLRSATSQTLREIEIIVVSDGSTDRTSGLVREAARLDPRVRLVETSNQGTSKARNAGIAEAQSELIAPLDADDLWHPSKLEKQVACLEKGGRGMGFVYCPYRLIDVQGKVIRSFPLFGCKGRTFLQHLCVNFVGNGSAVLFRRDLAERVGLYDPVIGAATAADYFLQLRLAEHYEVGLVAEYLVGYRLVPGSSSSGANGVAVSRREILEHYQAKLGRHLPLGLARWIEADIELSAAVACLRHGHLAGGAAALIRSTVLDPQRLLPELALRATRLGTSLLGHRALTEKSLDFLAIPISGEIAEPAPVIRKRLRYLRSLDSP